MAALQLLVGLLPAHPEHHESHITSDQQARTMSSASAVLLTREARLARPWARRETDMTQVGTE